MWWKYLVEFIGGWFLLVFAGVFWSYVKAPHHLKNVLNSPSELSEILKHIGHDTLIQESMNVEPVFGSFKGNIFAHSIAHKRSVEKSRTFGLIISIVLVILSAQLGSGFLYVNVVLFFAMLLFPTASHVKNQNATHIHTITLNLIRMYQEDAKTCFEFCINERPELLKLYRTIKVRVLESIRKERESE
ncbi:MAG: hypothetical protein RBT35_08050 [Bacteroidales bacterium]|jgi:CDP-diglyceride synthetase|nr:hypothetical protein [Bacteroidales bacterium]